MRRSDCSGQDTCGAKDSLTRTLYPTISNKRGLSQKQGQTGLPGNWGHEQVSLSLSLCVRACVRVCIHGWLFCCDILTIWGSFVHSFNKYLLSAHVTWRSWVTLTSSFSRMESMKAWLEKVTERKREEILGPMNMEHSRCFALHKLEEWGWGNILHTSRRDGEGGETEPGA